MSHQRFAERKKMSNPFLERENVLYLNSERCSTFYIERNENNCQWLSNMVEDRLVSSQSFQF